MRSEEKIHTFRDQWIPGLRSWPSLSSTGVEVSTVKTLIHDRNWNEPLIHDLFPSYIVQKILEIPISNSQYEDSRYWFFSSKGKYSVRDGINCKLDALIRLFTPRLHNPRVGGNFCGPSQSLPKFEYSGGEHYITLFLQA